MGTKNQFAGNTGINHNRNRVSGKYAVLDGEEYYKIENYDTIPPFFMTIISSSDLWMFISSKGGVTAGRKNPEYAIFPYYTDDKITDSSEITGNKTIIWITRGNDEYLWEPFSDYHAGLYSVKRNLYKNIPGNKILFEELNEDFDLTFRYSWLNSEKFGCIKKSEIINHSPEEVEIRLLDGVQNIIPYGTKRMMQNQYSNLLNAYKKNEFLSGSCIGIYYLSSIPTDMAEPSEGLKATIAYVNGIKEPVCLLSSSQVSDFRKGKDVFQEYDIRAERGAYFINTSLKITSGERLVWNIILDTGIDIVKIREIESEIKSKQIDNKLIDDINEGTDKLFRLVSLSDGVQLTANKNLSHRHFSNVLFNIMRGGIFLEGYRVSSKDYIQHVSRFKKSLLISCNQFLTDLPASLHYNDLFNKAEKTGDADLIRITLEYLPLAFSRRHGDPSRPWNLFSIETKNEGGGDKLYYEGNWRDIFQNWEALCMSFPGFIESMIAKFLNASTADGYNPYRITRNGFDWERPDPDDPWSNIGYWGDHQIIYLLKLLELSLKFHPEKLINYMNENIYVYANVPYKIKPYSDLLIDPQNTIIHDKELDNEIYDRANEIGEDGKLLYDENNVPIHVNFVEKILVSVLAKITNFIPGAGIWMNTQRPEWNDANNALVGHGTSMVTVFYLRRAAVFYQALFSENNHNNYEISGEVYTLFNQVFIILTKNQIYLEKSTDNQVRKQLMDDLGDTMSKYREIIYTKGLSGNKEKLNKKEIIIFFRLICKFLDHTIEENKRKDELYHAYNLWSVDKKTGIQIEHLQEMLEGQVAVMNSGIFNSAELIGLVNALQKSKLFRKDQNSYLLYPDKDLKKFTEKNCIDEKEVLAVPLLQRIIEKGDTSVIRKDITGQYHFNGIFKNVYVLREYLKQLESIIPDITEKEKEEVENLYEKVFNHKSFTGRSGTFFGYEGLGCIYWHMVSKLLLAVSENIINAYYSGIEQDSLDKMKEHYYSVKDGIGAEKSPADYGAFPSDPYSHTPGNRGVQQPGMTGQVKEDILIRYNELGIKIKDGSLGFEPLLLKKDEFLNEKRVFRYYDIQGIKKEINISSNSLAFTFCQLPVIYILSARNYIEIYSDNNVVMEVSGNTLSPEMSQQIFNRNSNIDFLKVRLNTIL